MGRRTNHGQQQQKRKQRNQPTAIIRDMVQLEQAADAFVRLKAGHATAAAGKLREVDKDAVLDRAQALFLESRPESEWPTYKEHLDARAAKERTKRLAEEAAAALKKRGKTRESAFLEMMKLYEPAGEDSFLPVPSCRGLRQLLALGDGYCFMRTLAHQLWSRNSAAFRRWYMLQTGKDLPFRYLDFLRVRSMA